MIRPTYIYRYNCSEDLKTDKYGTRFKLVNWDGADSYPILHNSYGEYPSKPALNVCWSIGLGNSFDMHKKKLFFMTPNGIHLTSLCEPEVEEVGKGFGVLSIDNESPGIDAILSLRDDECSSVLDLAIFPYMGEQAENLFNVWMNGGVEWEILPPFQSNVI